VMQPTDDTREVVAMLVLSALFTGTVLLFSALLTALVS
jgi:hypothetical protein